MSMKEHTLIWEQDVNLNMIIEILKRNYNDEERYGLCCGAAWYHFNEEQAALLNEKGYKVNAGVKYLFIRQTQPYLNINCIFGYDDKFEIKEGCCTMCGSAFLVEYTDEEKAEIEKMQAIDLYEEFELEEAEKIFDTLEFIELRKPEEIVRDAKDYLEFREPILASIENATPIKALIRFNDYMRCNDCIVKYQLPNGKEYACGCFEKSNDLFNFYGVDKISEIDESKFEVVEVQDLHNRIVEGLKKSIQEAKEQIEKYSK